ncbi:MAG TPA: glycosyltransferase, partial [bacterium]|nr:glycosyltransferase [bacterium]
MFSKFLELSRVILKRQKRIIIAVSHLHNNDSVSNCVFSMFANFQKSGYKTYILTDGIDADVKIKNVEIINNINNINKKDIVILHYGGMNDFIRKILEKDFNFVVYYHNVTPAIFFKDYSEDFYNWLINDDIEFLKYKNKLKNIVCVSNYSRNKLLGLGFNNIAVIPILFDFSHFEKINEDLYKKLRESNCRYLVFTGIVLPHKNQLELIKIFHLFLTKYSIPNIKLILIGKIIEQSKNYYNECLRYLEKYKLNDKVIFTDKISDYDRNSYYRCADIYVSASLHEGFGIPLVEAVYFNIPIVSYIAGAISETIDNCAKLIEVGACEKFADSIFEILNNEETRKKILEQYNDILKKYSPS